jgi:hypothetical protein
MTDNPGKPIPARVLLWLVLLFFVVPAVCCLGCVTAASLMPLPAGKSSIPIKTTD